MHPHERRPAVVRGVESGELRAVGIGAPRADHDCADRPAGAGEVGGECGFHGRGGVLGEGEVVAGGGGGDEGVDGGEGVGWGD